MPTRTRPHRLPAPDVTTLATLYTRFNRRLALIITSGVSTMECAYIFTFLAILGFPGTHATATAYVQWVSQTFIQLTMLSVLSVQQKITSDQAVTHHAHVTALHDAHAADITALHAKVDALAPKPRARKKAPQEDKAS